MKGTHNGVVLNAMNSSVLQRNNGAIIDNEHASMCNVLLVHLLIDTANRNRIDSVSWATCVPRTKATVVAGSNCNDLTARRDTTRNNGTGTLGPAIDTAKRHGENVISLPDTTEQRVDKHCRELSQRL